MFYKKAKRIKELEWQVFDLDHALTEAQQFERIASEKLQQWVQKHDELLIKYKACQK